MNPSVAPTTPKILPRRSLLGVCIMIGIFAVVFQLASSFAIAETVTQIIVLKGDAGGKRFDGIGVVNGGGATSVLLKDYPEPQRSQILDFVYKPKFGASVSALLVEIPGDGNSTQGSMPSHMHTRDDLDYTRGYTWWILSEAKKRNPRLSLDGTAWSAPGWIGESSTDSGPKGDAKFWSQDAAGYYVKWLKGLRDVYGLEFDAIGCRNEKGYSLPFAKILRATLDASGFENVKLHAFDHWPEHKFDFVKDLLSDAEARNAIDIIGAHVLYSKQPKGVPASAEVQAMAAKLGKPIWNTEEHVYKKGFDCAISIVQSFNDNYIRSGATRVVNWYDIAGLYSMEPYSEDPAMLLAHEPWSGHYQVREALWGYAHYGQFTEVGWQYLDSGCGDLAGGGTFVTLKSTYPENDYSIIIETKDATAPQQLRFEIGANLSNKQLCVWRSNAQEQFIQQSSIKPVNGVFTLTVESDSIYSLSTTTGQQKGAFDAIPAAKPFPFPYLEDFESYTSPKDSGHLPRYTADIAGAFEIADSPDGKGKSLHQVVPKPTISWAPDWQPYTIIGDAEWKDYEVSADVWLNAGDTAAVMGRINHVGTGYGFIPKGYFVQLDDSGQCRLVAIRGKKDKKKLTGDAEQQAIIASLKDDGEGGEKVLATTKLSDIRPDQWHTLKLRFEGTTITAFVDGKSVLTATDELYAHGMAGLLAGQGKTRISTPWFDNLAINAVNAPAPKSTAIPPAHMPLYNTASARRLIVGEGFVNPIGFHDAKPSFSWRLPTSIVRQTAYRIQSSTTSNKSWDSGWVESDQSTFVPYAGPALSSRESVSWRINFRDEKSVESGWSEPAHFELGLLSAEDWTAKWIRPSQEVDTSREPVAMMRRGFRIAKPVARARLYATARGIFELRLNDCRVGNEYFANGFTSYRHRIDTLTYDVTSLLCTGDNALEGLLGTGWYAGRFPFETKNIGPYGRDNALLVQLEITYADGSTERLVSDETWEGSFDGPIISASLYDGEKYDARRQPANWAPVSADVNLGDAQLTPKPFAPVRETKTVAAQQITQPQPGCYVFDLGQNMVGWARLNIPVEKDKIVSVRFAEMLQADGSLYTKNYRTAQSTDTYVAAQTGTIQWEPRFTFHGFRYVEISGLPADAKPKKNWVTGVVLRSDLPTTGRFVSSHAKLNQLQRNIVWGWWGNSVDIPTDCPQRDERMGWTGDAQVFCATSMFNTDAHAFWKSWLGSLRNDQYRDGAVPPYAPTAMSKWETRSPGWMEAATIIPWDLYVRTGDTEVLAENYAMMERLVGWYRSQAVNGLLPKIKGFGDWLQPYPNARSTPANRDADRRGDTPLPLLGAAFYARSAQILADTARALGRSDDALRYDKEAASIRAAFAREYFDAYGKLQNAPETQTAYALAIAFDLLAPELKIKAGENLVRLVREAGGHLRTGFLGTPHLATALDQTGHATVAAELLFKETYPSWFYPINQGATTMWERWNSYSHENGFGDASMNSFNHYAYGAIGQWMYERVAGLTADPARPGYKHFFVRPLIIAQLDSARAELDTPYGKAASGWTKSDGNIVMNITVPPNTTATIQFPDGRPAQTVGTGVHRFETAFPSSR